MVKYKFKDGTSWESITSDNNVISVLDIKRAIVHQSKLSELEDQNFDLLITNAVTGEMYKNDRYMIHRNMSLTVKKVRAKEGSALKNKLEATPAAARIKELEADDKEGEGDGSGEDETARVQEVMKETSSKYQENPHGWTGSGVRPNYVCHRSRKV